MLLDLIHPDIFGFDVLRSVREAGSTIPVIVMSAMVDEAYRTTHVAPVSRAQLLRFIVAGRRVTFNGAQVALTSLEFDLLCALIHAPGIVMARGELLRTVWNAPENLKTQTVSYHINSLRNKLRVAGVSDVIRTVRASGWVWTLPNCVAERPSLPNP